MQNHIEGQLIICDQQDTRDGLHDGQNMEWRLDHYEMEQEGEERWLWQCDGCEQFNLWSV